VYNISPPELVGGSTRLLIGKAVQLVRVSVNQLSGRESSRDSKGIEGAVIRALEELIDGLPGGAAIAVLSISSSDDETAESAIDELQYQLVKARFTIVTRKELDLVRSEHNLGAAGEVSDESAARIGHLAGADIIITGNVSGSGTTRRLTLNALDTTTGRVVANGRGLF
jgi:N-acetylmuramic acid 6-phosphate (MurNAc-6-P) etherase